MDNYDVQDLKKVKGSFQSRSNKLANVLDGDEYLRLVMIKLDALRSEVAIKEMEKIETINFNKKGRSR